MGYGEPAAQTRPNNGSTEPLVNPFSVFSLWSLFSVVNNLVYRTPHSHIP
jgi:hypothetical protein